MSEQDAILAVIAEGTATKAAEVDAAAATAEGARATLESAQATLTAEAAGPPTPTDMATPRGLTPAPTASPTATGTPTPDIPATQTTVSGAYATQTAEATTGCLLEPAKEFSNIWTRFRSQLGCPQKQAVGGFFAEQPFQRGYMYWSQILEVFVVTSGNEDEGTWEFFTKADVETFGENSNNINCKVDVPAGLVQPVRGFGTIWCARPDIQADIGFGTSHETGVKDNILQLFKGGIMLRNHNGDTYVLLADKNSTYVRTK